MIYTFGGGGTQTFFSSWSVRGVDMYCKFFLCVVVINSNKKKNSINSRYNIGLIIKGTKPPLTTTRKNSLECGGREKTRIVRVRLLSLLLEKNGCSRNPFMRVALTRDRQRKTHIQQIFSGIL